MLHTPHDSFYSTYQRPAAPRRGSVIILVVVVIGLMAFIGATFLQVARVQRQVVAEPVNNIDLVLQAVNAEIALQLKDDIFDPVTGNYFDVATGIETYDRPWTNAGSSYDVFGIDGTTVVGQALGGDGDDTWLASALPFDDGGIWKWRKITTLTGGWYNSDGNPAIAGRLVSDTVQGGSAPDLLIGQGGTLQDGRDYNHDGLASGGPHDHLVDADADGMGDSRWERAPITLKDGIEYFMAVRIVDLAAFLNANVAISAIDNSGAYDTSVLGTDAPQPQQPGEIDLGRFVFDIDGTGGFMNELNGVGGLLDVRGIAPGVARPLAFDGIRQDFWADGPRNYGNFQAPAVSLTSTDEVELRYRMGAFGLTSVASTLEAAMPGMMAHNVPDANVTSDAAAADLFAYGRVPRTRLTVSSGEALFAPTLPGETPTTRVLQYPLNQSIFEINTATATPAERAELDTALAEVSDVIQAVYAAGNAPTLPPTVNTPAEMGDQLAASLQDYRDVDNRITQVGTRFGFEALPFIAEVYVQRIYTATASNLTATGFEITWTASAAPVEAGGFAVELRNPFRRPIRLDNVTIWVNDGTTATQVTDGEDSAVDDIEDIILNSFSPATGNTPVFDYNVAQGRVDDPRTAADERAMLWPGDILVIYRNSGDLPSGSGPQQDIQPLIDTSGGNVIIAELPTTMATDVWSDAVDTTGANDDLADIRVELRGTAADGSPMIVPYENAASLSLADEFIEEDSVEDHFAGTVTPGTPDTGLFKAAHTGNDTELGLLMRPAANFREERLQPSNSTLFPDDLGGPKPDALAGTGLNEQVLIADDEDNRLYYVGELAQVAVLGFDATRTVGDILGFTNFPGDDLFLAMDNTAHPFIDASQPDWAMPHGQFVLGRFTTLSPQRDGSDNDNDGDIDEDDEQKLLGRLNLNTADEALLAGVLPFSDASIRQGVATDSVALRENSFTPTVPGTGFALVWQLWDGTVMPAMIDGVNAFNDTQGSITRYDFRQNYEFTPGSVTDNHVDDREELNMLMAMLGQVASTRSDVFVAYVLVHGYDSTNFAAGPVETGRQIVLFDRSGLLTANDAVVTSVLYRFP